MGYTKAVIKGVSWTATLSFVTKFVGFIETIILARILIPAQFGAYGVALLALGLLETITETGVNVVLVQEKELEQYIDSAWIVSIGRGIIIFICLFFASPWIAFFFHSKTSLELLYIISAVPFLRGFINPSVVKLQKDLKFGKNFWYQMIILFVNTSVSIVITYLTKQAIGIAIGLLCGVIVELCLSFIVMRPLPKFTFQKPYLLLIFHKGKWVTLSAIFNYLFLNSDNIVVGRILGSASLGIYQLAYSLAVLPLVEVSNVFIFVTFPILTKLSAQSVRLRNAYLKTILSVGILALPIVVILIIFPQIALDLLGNNWSKVVTVLPVLAVLGYVKTLYNSSTVLFLSEGKQRYITIVTLVTIIGMLSTIIPLTSRFGLVGAGSAALFGSFITIPLIAIYTWRIFSDKIK